VDGGLGALSHDIDSGFCGVLEKLESARIWAVVDSALKIAIGNLYRGFAVVEEACCASQPLANAFLATISLQHGRPCDSKHQRQVQPAEAKQEPEHVGNGSSPPMTQRH
jgi:hypothetical protein